jgi:hypothetical protein
MPPKSMNQPEVETSRITPAAALTDQRKANIRVLVNGRLAERVRQCADYMDSIENETWFVEELREEGYDVEETEYGIRVWLCAPRRTLLRAPVPSRDTSWDFDPMFWGACLGFVLALYLLYAALTVRVKP